MPEEKMPKLCPDCRKPPYRTRLEANTELLRLWKKFPAIPRRGSYQGDCGWFHLTAENTNKRYRKARRR